MADEILGEKVSMEDLELQKFTRRYPVAPTTYISANTGATPWWTRFSADRSTGIDE